MVEGIASDSYRAAFRVAVGAWLGHASSFEYLCQEEMQFPFLEQRGRGG